jgi:hypothetical protein
MPAIRRTRLPRKATARPRVGQAKAPEEFLARVTRVARLATLIEVSLFEFTASRLETTLGSAELPRLDIKVRVRNVVEDKHLNAYVVFTLVSSPESFKMNATYRLIYALPGPVATEDAKAFVETNALYNAWPFWRELVHSTAARMGITPSPVVPLLKL